MAERTHTPGPWRWYGGAIVGDHGLRPVVLMASRTGNLVTRGADGRLEPIPASHPNARLVVAAPKLLDALLAVEWEGEDFTDDGDYFDCCPNCGAPRGGLHYTHCELRDALDAALDVKTDRIIRPTRAALEATNA